jgi:putative pyruvate formate lyase activating enzyme
MNSDYKSCLKQKLDQALQILNNCEGCYRFCHINRWQSSKTYCHTGIKPKLYRTSIIEDNLFFNPKKIAKIYFQHCNLRCVYCYDYHIHHTKFLDDTKEISLEEYIEIISSFLKDQEVKAIQLTNVDHLIPHTLYVLTNLILQKKTILPIIFESNGFAFKPTLEFLRNFITIYICDFKFYSSDLARRFLKEEYYPEIVKESIKEMYYQVGDLEIKNGYIQKGLIVRILILPNFYKEYIKIIDFLSSISLKIGIFFDKNYLPSGIVKEKQIYNEINQIPSQKEIDAITQYATKKGFTNLFFL